MVHRRPRRPPDVKDAVRRAYGQTLGPSGLIEQDDSHNWEFCTVSYFIVYQSRLETKEALFVGYRSDRLRRVNGELKIAGRKIVLDSGILAASNLSIFF